jgi:exopolysaccharide production protein ExoY
MDQVLPFRLFQYEPRALPREADSGLRGFETEYRHGTLLMVRLPGSLGRRVFVIGAADEVMRTLPIVADRRRRNGSNGTYPFAGAVIDGELSERVRAECPDEVHLVVGGAMDEERVGALGARLLMDGVAVHLVLPRLGGLPLHAEAVCVGRRLSVSLRAVREDWLGRIVRRGIDIVGSLVLLALLSPVLIAVACLVWWRLGRPIVFVQKRIGWGGQLFNLYKFRSMVANAEEVLRASPEVWERYVASNYKLAENEDPRVTPLGRLLRRASLDELPQLWNVLRGDMSLVGPRPIVPDEIAAYGDYGRLLLRAKPGLTGLWQVSGRSRIAYPERARLDLSYVGERSLGLDLMILLRTLPVVISRRGAL